ncbi:MAG: DUF1330 domain-containing protein [Candidatus Acidiferrales bacterium]
MNANHKLALAVLAGVSIGVAGATAIHARQVKVPPAYVISEVDELQDLPTLQKYGGKVEETLAPFNHHFIVRSGRTQALEGEPPKGFVVLAFDSAEKAREWYDSPAYQAIKPLRQSSTKGRFFIVEGVVPQ